LHGGRAVAVKGERINIICLPKWARAVPGICLGEEVTLLSWSLYMWKMKGTLNRRKEVGGE